MHLNIYSSMHRWISFVADVENPDSARLPWPEVDRCRVFCPFRLPLPLRVLMRPEVIITIKSSDLSLLICRRTTFATVAFTGRRLLIDIVASWLLSFRHQRRWSPDHRAVSADQRSRPHFFTDEWSRSHFSADEWSRLHCAADEWSRPHFFADNPKMAAAASCCNFPLFGLIELMIEWLHYGTSEQVAT